MGPLLKPETTGVERGAAHAGARPSHAAETRADLFEAAAHWQLLLAWRAHQAPGGPVTVEGMFAEARDAAPRHRARTAGVRLDMLDVEAVWAEVFRSDHVW